MKPVKIGPLFMISIMVLATVGVSYAHWEETLYVSGIMYTDDIHPFFRNPLSNDPCGPELMLDPWEYGEWPNPSEFPTDWIGSRKNKDVGCTEIAIIDTAQTKIHIETLDAYPCYYTHLYWEIVNDGSVPVNLVSYKLVNLSCTVDIDGDGVNDIDVIIPRNRDMEIGTEYYIRWYDDGTVSIHEGEPAHPENFDFVIMPTGDFAIGDQLDPWDWQTDNNEHFEDPAEAHYIFYADLGIHFLNGCWQLACYDFDIEMVFYNWPELCDVGDLEFHNADLMLVLDRSGSINDSELALLKTAAKAFIDAIHTDDAITGQSSFATSATLDRHLTMDKALAKAAVDALTNGGTTDLAGGLNLANTELMTPTYNPAIDPPNSIGDRVADGDYPDYIVCITDGAPNVGGDPYGDAWDAANASDAHGIEVFVVGVGLTPGGSDELFLQNKIATTPGHYFGAGDYDDLEQVLQDIVNPP